MPGTLILTNGLETAKKHLQGVSGPVRFLDLVNSPAGLDIREHLQSFPGFQEHLRADLLRDGRETFRRKYVNFMGKVNQRNHSLLWWAMLFTDKNPISPSLYRDANYFLIIVELMRDCEDTFVVVSDSEDLFAQVKVWSRNSGVRVEGSVSTGFSLRRAIKTHTPVPLVYAVWRAALYSLLSWRFRPSVNRNDSHLVISSLSHPGSIASDGTYHDTYFEPLLERLRDSGKKALVFAMVVEQPRPQFKMLKQARKETNVVPVVPMDACLTIWGLTACVVRSAARFLRPAPLKGRAEIDGVDLSCLVNRTIQADSRSGNYFMALRLYYCARQLAKTVNISRCIYPYENLSWEKMLLTGIREVSPVTATTGYQHSSITVGHTTFLLEETESEVTPLPDEIITTGDVTKDWLEESGNYPAGMFRSACALRQSRTRPESLRERRPNIRRLLVALGTSRQEYRQVLKLLEQAFAGSNLSIGYEIRVRPHPLISLEPVLAETGLDSQDFFSVSSGPLNSEFDWADVVIYASSTVGLEAVSLDIPAVFLDVDEMLETDPMFGWNNLKWTATGPTELVSALQQIEGLDDERFRVLQMSGRDYADSYLRPITDSALDILEGTTSDESKVDSGNQASPEFSHSNLR
jgi:surface carbohydrate biosynthesis protein (TIGR04326 family)